MAWLITIDFVSNLKLVVSGGKDMFLFPTQAVMLVFSEDIVGFLVSWSSIVWSMLRLISHNCRLWWEEVQNLSEPFLKVSSFHLMLQSPSFLQNTVQPLQKKSFFTNYMQITTCFPYPEGILNPPFQTKTSCRCPWYWS